MEDGKAKRLKNLKPVKNSEEARRLGKIGGIRSGEVRRARKALKETLSHLLTLPPGYSEQKEALQALGIDEDDCTNQTLMAVSMIQAAIHGDVKAAIWVRDTVGEKPADKVDATVSTSSPIDDELAGLSLEELREIAGLDEE